MENNTRISESRYSSLERLPERAETDSFNMKFLNGMKNKKLRLSIDDIRCIKWYVDAASTMHANYKSHTGATMTFGEGEVQSISRKQKLNTRSSAEAKLVAVHDAAIMILWMKLFLEEQGYMVKNCSG